MARLRLLITALAIWLVVLFNMARPDIFLGRLNLTIQLSPVVYAIASAGVVLILLLPDLGQVPILAIFIPLLIVYGIARMVFTPVDPWEPKHTLYFVIVEMLTIYGTVYVARVISMAVSNFEKAVENIVVGPTDSRVLSKSEGIEADNVELYRARMFNHMLNLMYINVAGLPEMEADLGPNPSLEKVFQRRYLQNQIAHIVEISVYRTDIICWYRDSLLVCMPETTPDYATKIAGHLNELIFAHIGKNIMMGISTFPTDGLILEDLIAIASENLHLFEKAKTGPLVAFVDEQKNPTAPREAGPRTTLTAIKDHETSPDKREEVGRHEEVADHLNAPRGTGNMTISSSKSPRLLEPLSLNRGAVAATLSFDLLDNLRRSLTDVIPMPTAQPTGRPASNRPDDPDFWLHRLPHQSHTSRSAYHIVKRVFDLSVVLFTAPLTAPILILVAVLILLDNGRPIIFAQERTGQGGHRFKMYKFRTMVPNAEAVLRQLAAKGLAQLDSNGKLAAPLKLDQDPRITRIGAILRKTSLDELPQILNVLRGDMSLVGPRPTSWAVNSYTMLQTERLNAKPGITGLWQVYGRGNTDFSDWVKWDTLYYEKISLSLDIRILLLTAKQVLARRGAR